MEIILCSPLPPPYGGIANWTNMLLGNAKKHDIQIHHINTAPKKRLTDGRSFFSRAYNGYKNILSTKKELKHRLNSSNTDAVHITTSFSLAVIRDIILAKICKKHNVRCILHAHIGNLPTLLSKNNLRKRMIIKACKIASGVIVLDNESKLSLQKVGINNVYNISNFINITNDIITNNKDKKRNFLFVGWVIKTKGIEELLGAFSKVLSQYGDIYMTIAGPYNDKYFSYLKKQYKMDNVEFIGEVPHDNINKLMQESLALVLPSYTEGFPYVILEAMSNRLPVIATPVGGIPEMLGDDCGIITKKYNAEDLAVKMTYVLQNENNISKIADNAYKKVTSLYSIDAIIAQYINVWKDRSN